MTDTDVPTLTVMDEGDTEPKEPTPRFKRSDSWHVDYDSLNRSNEELKQEAIRFFSQHNVTSAMCGLLASLLTEMPQNVVSYCQEFLRTADAVSPSKPRSVTIWPESTDPREQIRIVMEDAMKDDAKRAFISEHRLVALFEDLLQAILLERPTDVHSFCLTWLRWNGHAYEPSRPEESN